ncbi:endonuclease III domain-containing protein [Hydrogenivirga sp. 128-5-R1-1]|uniref:endonuclease III domain-containing protein n=1 Tax=Hydrogenivirga sp. 128-5-R1-1 TaxID=392423 RepID=UPI00015EF9F7|nr:endonuclease III domain-containing protein [Hydrogenivirga sp. 128-5-R1-1]EDP75307.1 endonuclease III [Hydrogenivirga sp. 128-5-R1-1]
MRSSRSELLEVYETLLNAYGEQNWWPVDLRYHREMGSDPREEIVIGAILTQNTAWKNVERALDNLKRAKLLSFEGILKTPVGKLQELIRPSGYYRQKAERLKNVAEFLNPVSSVEKISREELLDIKGVGRETADAVLLYAGNRPFFVIDAYTKRIVKRVFGIEGSYEGLRRWFEDNLPKDIKLYKEFHALLDEHAKRFCRKKPACDKCPINHLCTQP